MDLKVVDILKKVGYPEVSEVSAKDIIQDGPKSISYTQVVEWLSKELSRLGNLDDHVNAITSQDDSSAFLLELSGFLKEIGCQYKSLTEGHVNERLQSPADRLLLLDYLVTELIAARIIATNNPETNDMLITLNESATARDLKNLLSALGLSVPDNLTPEELFTEIQEKVEAVLQKAPEDLIGKPLLSGEVTSQQWERISEILSELQIEYETRRQMLLKRLDVTVQSFTWSERMVGKEDDIASVYCPLRQSLKAEPHVDLADVLAAREDLTVLEKTSCNSVRMGTQSSVNKVVIGRVPDRGGRPNEQQPPPPEMPSWTQRSGGGGAHGYRGRGGRGRGRGRGGWNNGRDDRDREHHDDGEKKHRRKPNDRGYISERDWQRRS